MLFSWMVLSLAAQTPEQQQAAQLEYQQRIQCQQTAERLARTPSYLAPPDISEENIAAHAAADFLAQGGDWPKGTAAFLMQWNITPEQLAQAKANMGRQVDQQPEAALAPIMRHCQAWHGEPIVSQDEEW